MDWVSNYVSLVNWVRTAVWVWINSCLKLWKESHNNWPQCQMYCEAVEKLRKMGGKVALFQLSGKAWVATYHLFTVGAATTRHNYHADPRNHWFVNPTPCNIELGTLYCELVIIEYSFLIIKCDVVLSALLAWRCYIGGPAEMATNLFQSWVCSQF